MGRKKIDISGKEVEKLASYGLTNTEIAEFFGVNESTIRRRFADFLTKGRATAKMKLRRKQMQVALAGNVSMLIWLGKQILGQKESPVDVSDITITVKRSEVVSSGG
jgi:transcription initiation factor TFIIIB Brf1 subunit/transcription initiation factor TFIIB